MSIVGTFFVLAPKILFTPKPLLQLHCTTPTAPAFSSASASALAFRPVLLMRLRQASVAASFSFFIFSADSFVPNSVQLYSGLPVGCCIEISTNLPLTDGNHL